MPTHFCSVNGVRIAYEQEGTGPALVFLHGGNSSSVQWESLIPCLMDEYTCYAVNARGHGESERSATADYRMTTLVDELAGFLDAVSGPAICVGQSQGGALAMGVAAKRPDLVRAVVCEDSVPYLYERTRAQANPIMKFFAAAGAAARERDAFPESLLQYARRIGEIPAGAGSLADLLGPLRLVRFARSVYRTDPDYYAGLISPEWGWTAEEVAEVVANVRCPVHLAYGNPRLGGMIRSGDIEALANAGVNLTSTYFEGAGHDMVDCPVEYLADLRPFLARIS